MAWSASPVSSAHMSAAAISPQTVAFTPTAGNLVLIYLADYSSNAPSPTVVITNSGGTTIATATLLVSRGRSGGVFSALIYGVIAPAAAANVKVTVSTDSIYFYAEEWSGAAATVITDGSGSNDSASSAANPLSNWSTSVATDLIVGLLVTPASYGASPSWSTGTPGLTLGNTTINTAFTGYVVQSAAASINLQATWGTARQSAAVAVALVPASGVLTASSTATLGGAAVGAVKVTATASSNFTLNGAATGAVSIASTASGLATLTGLAAGLVGITATGTGTASLVGSATGAVTIAATAAGTATLTSTAVGTISIAATAASTATLTATAVGVVNTAVPGTGASTATLTGAAVGTLKSQASSTATLTGAAVAQINLPEHAASTATLTGTAVGVHQGSAVVQVAEVSNFSAGAAVSNFSAGANVQNFQQS